MSNAFTGGVSRGNSGTDIVTDSPTDNFVVAASYGTKTDNGTSNTYLA
jgi:hypothetical protein